MAVADKITQLTDIRDDIRDALVEQGIEDATTHNYIDFAEDILAIEGGGVIPIVITDDTYDMNTTDAYMTENAGKFIISSLIYDIPADTDEITLTSDNYYKLYSGETLYAYSHNATPLTDYVVHLPAGDLLKNSSGDDAICLPPGAYATINSGSSLPFIMDPTKYYTTSDLSCMMFKTAQIVNVVGPGQTYPITLNPGKAAYNNWGSNVYVIRDIRPDSWVNVSIADEDWVANGMVDIQLHVTNDWGKGTSDIASIIILVPGVNETTQAYDLYHIFDSAMRTGSQTTSGWMEIAPHVNATPTITRVASIASNATGAARLRPVGLEGTNTEWLALAATYLSFTLKLGNATWLGRAQQDWRILVTLK